MIFNCCGTGKQKAVENTAQRAATIIKVHLASAKSKATLCPLHQFSKTYNEADHIKTCVLACVDSRYELKVG